MRNGTLLNSPKFQAPQISNVFVRERLQSLTKDKQGALWVTSPAGAGKTTVVACSLYNKKALWYRVDELDQDISAFFYYFNALVVSSNRVKNIELPLFTQEYQGSLTSFARNYFRLFFSFINEDFSIVFDNYQEANGAEELDQVIKIAIEESPSNMTIYVISRNYPSSIFSRLKIQNNLSIVDYDEIRFTQYEESELIEYLKNDLYDKQEKEQIYSITQGWITGLLLILEKSKASGNISLKESLNNQQSTFDYLTSELFDKLDQSVKNLLLKTAFLKSFSIQQALDITGEESVADILNGLMSDRFFISITTKEDMYYEYHPLLRMFLIEQVHNQFSLEEQILIKNKTAAILKQSNEYLYAAQLYIEIKDWKSLVEIILTHAQEYINQGLQNILERYISQLPSAICEENTWLIFWMGVSQLAISPRSARDSFKKAYNLFKSKKDITGQYLAWSGVINTYIYEWNGFVELDYWISEGELLNKENPDFPSQEIGARFSFGMFAAMMYRQPNRAELEPWADAVWKIIQHCPDMSARMMMGNLLLLYYNWWKGDMSLSGILIETLAVHLQTEDLPPLTKVVWYSINASYSWLTVEPKIALQLTKQGLKLSKETGINLWDFMLYAQSAWASLIQGDISSADYNLKKMSTAHNHESGMNVCLYHDTAAIVELNKGDFQKALRHAKTALDQARVTGMPFAEAMTHISCAMAYMRLKQYKSAREHLGQSIEIGKSMNSHYIDFLSSFANANLSLEQNDSDSAIKSLRKGLELSKTYKLTIHVWFSIDKWKELLIAALEHDVEIAYVQYLIKIRNIVPKDIPKAVENWPWEIKIYTLGQFKICRNGEFIDLHKKSINKPVEMLKVLLSLGGQEVPEERIMDAMWPDADGDQARSSFKTTLHRLRKVLDKPDILQMNSGRLSLNERYCWVDSWYLNQLCQKITSSSSKFENTNHEKLIVKILKIYNGHFLDSEHAAWAIHHRDTLRQQTVRQLIKLIQDMEVIHQELSIDYYLRLLELDPLIEPAYHGLLRLYKAQGHYIEAEKLNKKYTDLLEKIL